MRGGAGPLATLAGAAAGKVAAAAGALIAVAAVVIVAGGGGLLGPLGALVTGDHQRSSTTSAARGDRGGERLAAIVAEPSAGVRRERASARAPARGAPTGGYDRGRPAPGPDAPGPGAPEGGPPAPAPAPLPPGAAPPAPPPGGGQQTAADRLDAAVDEIRGQAPEPVRPALEPVGELTDTIAETCRQLPVCP